MMNFSGISILVVGDVMLDHYIIGTASRVSPEAPVPVVNRQRAWVVPGGAANVARGLARLGCDARLVGLTGADAAGTTLKQGIRAEGIACGIMKSTSRPTICKTRIMANGQQLLRVDEETVQPPDMEEYTGLRINLEKLLPGCAAIILSDYAKGVLLKMKNGDSLCSQTIAAAAKMNIPVLVDPKGTDWERYAGAACVTPNMAEFTAVGANFAAGGNLREDGRLRAAVAGELCASLNLRRILVTRGAQGMDLYVPGQKTEHIRAARKEVADVSGAGDTVIATLAACVAAGESWEQSAIIANAAAGVAVGKLGAAPVSVTELNHVLRQNRQNPKLYSSAELEDKITDWRHQGQSIVFTNGCFDLLHPGHLSLLRQCAEMGDRLIVGLNSDASIKRLKGASRPIQNEASRAQLLAALHNVDAVVIFDEDTPEKLIHAIRPDVLVKGSDYSIDQVVGSDFVLSNGGQVRLVQLEDGFSTTSLVKKITESGDN